MDTDKKALNTLLKVGFAEGISFLILLGIAMPLKYIGHMPTPVRVVGMLHGVLFIWYSVALYHAKTAYSWSTRKAAIGFLLSFLPFGTFFLEKTLKKEM
ncbi:MAG: DUF3817 domain-containing protein [Bacteroidia bacterium]